MLFLVAMLDRAITFKDVLLWGGGALIVFGLIGLALSFLAKLASGWNR